MRYPEQESVIAIGDPIVLAAQGRADINGVYAVGQVQEGYAPLPPRGPNRHARRAAAARARRRS